MSNEFNILNYPVYGTFISKEETQNYKIFVKVFKILVLFLML
jgi:hypothetical protein